jgi:hypothetical protein
MSELDRPLYINGAGYLYVPDDITALETAKLTELLAKVDASTRMTITPKRQAEELGNLVKANGLERMFKQEKLDAPA